MNKIQNNIFITLFESSTSQRNASFCLNPQKFLICSLNETNPTSSEIVLFKYLFYHVCVGINVYSLLCNENLLALIHILRKFHNAQMSLQPMHDTQLFLNYFLRYIFERKQQLLPSKA